MLLIDVSVIVFGAKDQAFTYMYDLCDDRGPSLCVRQSAWNFDGLSAG